MSDPVQNIMRQLCKAGTRISISPDGGIRLSGTQPTPELLQVVKANKDALLARMRAQGIGTGTDQYRNALPFSYTVPEWCFADKHCRRYGLCHEHLSYCRCGTDEPEDLPQVPGDGYPDLGETVSNILALNSPELFQLAQELVLTPPTDPHFEHDTTAFLIALSVLMTDQTQGAAA
jgi:hypothetical protein